MSEKENLETVRQAYRAFGEGDTDGFLALLATDVEWMMPEVGGIPFTGNCRGRTQVGEFLKALGEAEETLQFAQDEFIVTGSQVGVTGRYRARIRATDKTVETAYAHFFTVVDGKIHSFREYYDTAAVAEAYRGDTEKES
jgi:hypothetical protein